MLFLFAAIFTSLALPMSAVLPLEREDRWIEGTWIAQSRSGQIDSHVRISNCGNGTPCGVLIWIDPASNPQKLDIRNPNRSLRTRLLIGTPILSGFTKQGDVWRLGRLYNPEDGMSFACSIARGQNGGRDGQLHVTGCLGPLCQTKIWRRLGND